MKELTKVAFFARRVRFTALDRLYVVEVTNGQNLMSRGFSTASFDEASEEAREALHRGPEARLLFLDKEIHEVKGGREQSEWQ